jgi:hypothetical protein
MARAALIAALCLAGAVARAAPIALDGCASVVDAGALRELLRIELGREAAEADPGGMVARCAARGEVTVMVGARTHQVSLAEVPPRMRARTLALAIAEAWRRAREDTAIEQEKEKQRELEQEREEEKARAAAEEQVRQAGDRENPLDKPVEKPPETPVVLKPITRPANPKLRRIYGGLSIGLFCFSLAGIAIGAPLVAIQPTAPEFDSLNGTGLGFLSLSGAAFTGSIVTFSLYMVEKKRAAKPR